MSAREKRSPFRPDDPLLAAVGDAIRAARRIYRGPGGAAHVLNVVDIALREEGIVRQPAPKPTGTWRHKEVF